MLGLADENPAGFMGLDQPALSVAPPDTAGLGIAPAAAAPAPATPGPGMFGKIALALEAFGAGSQGQEPLYLKLQKQEMLKRQQKLGELKDQLEIATKISDQALLIPDEKGRKKFIDAAKTRFAANDADFAEFIDSVSARPDLLRSLPQFAQKDPVLRELAAGGDRKALSAYLKSEPGRKHWNEIAVASFAPEFQRALPGMIDWHQRNNVEEYEKIVADNRVTIPELRRMYDALPENLKPSEAAFAALTAPENQKSLIGMLGGIEIVTDESLAKSQERADKDPEYVKLLNERDQVQERLNKVKSSTERARLQTRLSDLNGLIQKRQAIVGRTEFDVTTPTKTFTTELQRQLKSDDDALSQIDALLIQLKGDPARGIKPMTEATGVAGWAIENVGGLAEQVPGVGDHVAELFNSKDVTKVRTGMRLVLGSTISRITGDTSGRYSDRDQKLADATLRGLNPMASFPQITAAYETVRDIIARGRVRTAARLRDASGDSAGTSGPEAPPEDEWIARARKLPENADYSEDDLRAFYRKKYGGKK